MADEVARHRSIAGTCMGNAFRLLPAERRKQSVILVTVALAIFVGGCSKQPTRLGQPVPPSTFALTPYSEPVWMPDGLQLGFNHSPLRSVSYDPKTGDVAYDWVDSFAGWWVIRTDGSNLRRHIAAFLSTPAASPRGDKLALSLASSGGRKLFTLPIVGGLPDSSGLALIPTPGQAALPRWSPAGDSLVYLGVDSPRGSWVVGSDGGGARLALAPLDYPDWHPRQHRLLGVLTEDSAGTRVSRIVNYDLDTKVLSMLLRSTSVEYELPRYAPAGARFGFVQHPIDAGGPEELWVADSTGGHSQRLVTGHVAQSYAWSPAGDEIAYVKYDLYDFTLSNGTVWIVTTATGATRLLAGHHNGRSSAC